MDDEEETPPLNWAEIHKGQMDMAELVFCYHQALIGAGFSDMRALQLSASYQWAMMAMGSQQ